MSDYRFEVTYDRRLRFTLSTDDRTDVYTSTEEINFGKDSRIIQASIDDSGGYRMVTFKNGVDKESLEKLGETILRPLPPVVVRDDGIDGEAAS